MTDTAREKAMRAAVVDLTSAYHHERKHAGKWDRCQRPRCQNARLAIEGRGPLVVPDATPVAAADSGGSEPLQLGLRDEALFMAIAEDRHDLLIADEGQETLHPAVQFDLCDDSVCVEVRTRRQSEDT